MKLDFGLKSRIYGGFGALVVLGLGLALFAGWQLHLIGASVGQMSAISDAVKWAEEILKEIDSRWPSKEMKI